MTGFPNPSSAGTLGSAASPAQPNTLHHDKDKTALSTEDSDNSQLLRSFDMIFQLHQRSEEIRRSLDLVDAILLTSRTVPGLVERVSRSLETDLNLTAVRMLFREDHPMVSVFDFEAPANMGIIPQPLMENETLFHSEPYVLDDPTGDLGHSLFGEAATRVASAVVANLYEGHDELGLLCLGSSDAQRYCGGMNMELIASLSEKISLGLSNAWDHEIRARQALMGEVEGIYSESFLKEYLAKEFGRSWRTFRPFSLMALSWGFSYAVGAERANDLMYLVRSNLRTADLVAEGETVDLWVLLPDTDIDGARTAAERIVQMANDSSFSATRVYAGITAFAREAVTTHKLMNQAKLALQTAMENDHEPVVVQSVLLA